MSNNHRFKATPSGPRYRWTLPDDLQEIKLLAFEQGMISATEQKKQGVELTQEALEAGSIETALLLEKETRAGRSGCNNPVLFRQTFADIHARIWQAVFTYWNEAPAVYSSFMHRPPQQQVANARKMAELYLPIIEQCIAAGKPIRFEW